MIMTSAHALCLLVHSALLSMMGFDMVADVALESRKFLVGTSSEDTTNGALCDGDGNDGAKTDHALEAATLSSAASESATLPITVAALRLSHAPRCQVAPARRWQEAAARAKDLEQARAIAKMSPALFNALAAVQDARRNDPCREADRGVSTADVEPVIDHWRMRAAQCAPRHVRGDAISSRNACSSASQGEQDLSLQRARTIANMSPDLFQAVYATRTTGSADGFRRERRPSRARRIRVEEASPRGVAMRATEAMLHAIEAADQDEQTRQANETAPTVTSSASSSASVAIPAAILAAIPTTMIAAANTQGETYIF
jgi:hypothetical protein